MTPPPPPERKTGLDPVVVEYYCEPYRRMIEITEKTVNNSSFSNVVRNGKTAENHKYEDNSNRGSCEISVRLSNIIISNVIATAVSTAFYRTSIRIIEPYKLMDSV